MFRLTAQEKRLILRRRRNKVNSQILDGKKAGMVKDVISKNFNLLDKARGNINKLLYTRDMGQAFEPDIVNDLRKLLNNLNSMINKGTQDIQDYLDDLTPPRFSSKPFFNKRPWE